MLQAFEIMFNGVWSILNISIPVSENINFTLWQYFFFIFLAIHLIKKLFDKGVEQ